MFCGRNIYKCINSMIMTIILRFATQYFNPNYVRRHFSISINITSTRYLSLGMDFYLSFAIHRDNSLSSTLAHQHILKFHHCVGNTAILKIPFLNKRNQRSQKRKIERNGRKISNRGKKNTHTSLSVYFNC